MAWWLIATGGLLFLLGLFVKIKEYEDYGDYKDFQNLTTQKRYIRRNDNENINNNDKSLEMVVKDAEKKQKRLSMINENLDQIIQEISKKEKKIQDSLAEMNSKTTNQSLNNNFKKILNKTSEEINENTLSEKHKKIINLYEDGFSEEEIADKLNIGVRETGLILRMHKRGAAND